VGLVAFAYAIPGCEEDLGIVSWYGARADDVDDRVVRI
jgi:hypothetical protein